MVEPTRPPSPNIIEVLSGLQAVRLRPTLYVGSLDDPLLPTRLLRQALCHAIDEAVDGGCTQIQISLSEAGAKVRYDAGLPLEPTPGGGTVAEEMLTALHACSGRKKHIQVGQEHCELGLAVLTALCRSLEVKVVWRGQAASLHFVEGRRVEGRRVEGGRVEGPAPLAADAADGTELALALDPTFLGEHPRFDRAELGRVARALEEEFARLTVTVHEAPPRVGGPHNGGSDQR